MKTIIHIGQHKTGTTSIQYYLRDNREQLEKKGLYVPSKIAGFENPSHFILNVYSLSGNRYSQKKEEILSSKGKQYIDELEKVLKSDIAQIYQDASNKGCDKIIWSNEGLYLLKSVAEYKKLVSLFKPYSSETEVVCCFREVASYRKSYIKELKKHHISLSQDQDSYRYVETDSWLLNYEDKKQILSKVFNKCIFFAYDPDDNVNKFMNAIGYNCEDTKNYKKNVTGKLIQRIRKRLPFFELLRTPKINK